MHAPQDGRLGLQVSYPVTRFLLLCCVKAVIGWLEMREGRSCEGMSV